VLYEMITGQLPFKGDYASAVAYSIVNENPQPITGLRSSVPMELQRISNKALAQNVDERYQHLDEMLTDLKNLTKTVDTAANSQPSAAAEKTSRNKLSKNFCSYLVLSFYLLQVS